MLCSIYKSPKKEGTYLYIPKRDDFSQVPDTLKQMFGKPILSCWSILSSVSWRK